MRRVDYWRGFFFSAPALEDHPVRREGAEAGHRLVEKWERNPPLLLLALARVVGEYESLRRRLARKIEPS